MDKMKEKCIEANLPAPTLSVKGNDFWITFRKDIYNRVDLGLFGLSERPIKAVLYVPKIMGK
ncbi:hypothetical protein [Dysgonomonas sp.]